jgi:hypothetical protein
MRLIKEMNCTVGTPFLLPCNKNGVTSTFVFELCFDQPVIINVSNNFGDFYPKRTEVRVLVTLPLVLTRAHFFKAPTNPSDFFQAP